MMIGFAMLFSPLTGILFLPKKDSSFIVFQHDWDGKYLYYIRRFFLRLLRVQKEPKSTDLRKKVFFAQMNN